jgi:peptidyl-dipeptidase A
MKRARWIAIALVVFVFTPLAMGQTGAAAKASAKKAAPTVAEAKEFLDDAEQRYFELTNKAQRAQWVQENFITDDTEEIGA